MEFMQTVDILHICQDRHSDMLSFRQSRLMRFIRMILLYVMRKKTILYQNKGEKI